MGDLLSKLLSVFMLCAIVRAGYFIDDADPTIRYTPDLEWTLLNLTNGNYIGIGNGSRILVDYGRLHNFTSYVIFSAVCDIADLFQNL